ncbi:MAG: tetratricopeptide repeat protein [Kofleriaceae bacterium]|nr:tetratricopeptide repeat protein [Kofleriaceae bacterium]
MSSAEVAADRVAAFLSIGDFDQAGRLVESFATSDPPAHAVGYAMLAIAKGDAATAMTQALRAVELKAGAVGHQQLALAQLLAGEPQAAVDSARRAVALDASIRHRSSLGTVLLAARRPQDAAGVLRQVVAEAPTHHEALVNLGNASVEIGDYATAITSYARAFDADPTKHQPIQNMMGMFAELGKWLGAIGALEMARANEPPPEVNLAFDIAVLQMLRLIGNGFPPPNVGDDADRAVENTLAHATGRSTKVQLEVVRVLADLGRKDQARALLDRIVRQPLGTAEQALVLYLRGVFANNPAEALALFEQSYGTDPTRIDAYVNASQILVEQGTPEALDKLEQLFASVPPERRTPDLLLNEAVYLVKRNRRDEARVLLERVVRATNGGGRIGTVARQALRELAG